MKAWWSSLVVLCGLGLAVESLAQCHGKSSGQDEKAATVQTCNKDKAASGSKDAAACAAACKDKAGCDPAACGGKAVAAGMPRMQYKVSDQTVCCPGKADELAKGDKSQIHYIVAGKEHGDQTEAMKAYEGELEGLLATLTSVRYAVGEQCVAGPDAAQRLARERGESVKFRVASYTYTDRAAAEKAAQAASNAAEQITMKMVVDGKTYTCEKEAAAAAKGGSCHGSGAGKSTEYVVGETKTSCPVTAKVELAKARIDAALTALERVNGKDVAASGDPSGA